MLLMFTYSYLVWYISIRPHKYNHRFYMEVLNESLLMVLSYHLIMFSDYNLNPDFVYTMGNWFVYITYSLILVNLGYIINKDIAKLIRNRNLAGMRK